MKDIFENLFDDEFDEDSLECPECGSEMSYSYLKNEYKCFNCGYTELEEPPEGCDACGGDWPNCKASCSLYDD